MNRSSRSPIGRTGRCGGRIPPGRCVRALRRGWRSVPLPAPPRPTATPPATSARGQPSPEPAGRRGTVPPRRVPTRFPRRRPSAEPRRTRIPGRRRLNLCRCRRARGSVPGRASGHRRRPGRRTRRPGTGGRPTMRGRRTSGHRWRSPAAGRWARRRCPAARVSSWPSGCHSAGPRLQAQHPRRPTSAGPACEPDFDDGLPLHPVMLRPMSTGGANGDPEPRGDRRRRRAPPPTAP